MSRLFIFIFYILFNVYIQPLGYDRPTRFSTISVYGDHIHTTALKRNLVFYFFLAFWPPIFPSSSETCRVFLMNVKLEIHGLRLAAASRVFSINPIWQPNVEAQAIKRAHRIGQMRRCPWKPPSSKKKKAQGSNTPAKKADGHGRASDGREDPVGHPLMLAITKDSRRQFITDSRLVSGIQQSRQYGRRD